MLFWHSTEDIQKNIAAATDLEMDWLIWNILSVYELETFTKLRGWQQKIHLKQAGQPYEKKIVGGGIPFYDGTVEIVNKL